MRTGMFFSILALFVAISFVPPGEGKPLIEKKIDVNLSADLDLPNKDEVRAALDTLKSAIETSTVAATAAVDGVKGVSIAVDSTIENVPSVQVEVAPANVAAWREAKASDPDEAIRKQFAQVEWAKEKNEIQACHDLTPVVLDERVVDGKKVKTPAESDWLAYCLARVAGEAKRCKQIAGDTSPNLRMLCDEELQ